MRFGDACLYVQTYYAHVHLFILSSVSSSSFLPKFILFSSAYEFKKGRIHGYKSHVQVGRGSDKKDDLSIWAGAALQKPLVNAKKQC